MGRSYGGICLRRVSKAIECGEFYTQISVEIIEITVVLYSSGHKSYCHMMGEG